MMTSRKILVVLHDIRSSENVGSIFRTADAAGVSNIYLTGYTTSPVDRFGRANSKLAKAALGAEKTMPWEQDQDVYALIKKLRKEKVQVVAVEQDEKSDSYMTLVLGDVVAFVLGNEVEGLPRDVLQACDAISEIPMHGEKESLNVSVSAGVILFHARSAKNI